MGQVTFDSLKAPLDRFLLPYYVVFWRAGACCRYRGGVRQCLYLRHGADGVTVRRAVYV
jgi:hypothetical protein